MLAACARAAWYLAAALDVRCVFQHIPGIEMVVADALSRRHINISFDNVVKQFLQDNPVVMIKPNVELLDFSKFM